MARKMEDVFKDQEHEVDAFGDALRTVDRAEWQQQDDAIWEEDEEDDANEDFRKSILAGIDQADAVFRVKRDEVDWI